jgi:hypothetical protein
MTLAECVPGVRVRLNKLGRDVYYRVPLSFDPAVPGTVMDRPVHEGQAAVCWWEVPNGRCSGYHLPEYLEPVADD